MTAPTTTVKAPADARRGPTYLLIASRTSKGAVLRRL
jgi:hypothetical protein